MFVVHEHIGARGSRESNLEEKRRKRASERKRNSERTSRRCSRGGIRTAARREQKRGSGNEIEKAAYEGRQSERKNERIRDRDGARG